MFASLLFALRYFYLFSSLRVGMTVYLLGFMPSPTYNSIRNIVLRRVRKTLAYDPRTRRSTHFQLPIIVGDGIHYKKLALSSWSVAKDIKANLSHYLVLFGVAVIPLWRDVRFATICFALLSCYEILFYIYIFYITNNQLFNNSTIEILEFVNI